MTHVSIANEHTAPGVLDHIEYQAKALVDTLRIEQSEIVVNNRRMIGAQEDSRREAAGAEEDARRENAAGSPEGAVYADLATEALGGTAAKLVKDGLDFLSDMDPGKGVSINGKQVDTFESLIKRSAGKGDGLFGPAEANALTLSEKFGQVSTSLAAQGECNTKSWSMRSADMPSTHMQQNLVFGKELASEQALASVARARMIQAPAMGMGGMGASRASATPTVSLAQGPKFSLPPDEEFIAEESASWA